MTETVETNKIKKKTFFNFDFILALDDLRDFYFQCYKIVIDDRQSHFETFGFYIHHHYNV